MRRKRPVAATAAAALLFLAAFSAGPTAAAAHRRPARQVVATEAEAVTTRLTRPPVADELLYAPGGRGGLRTVVNLQLPHPVLLAPLRPARQVDAGQSSHGDGVRGAGAVGEAASAHDADEPARPVACRPYGDAPVAFRVMGSWSCALARADAFTIVPADCDADFLVTRMSVVVDEPLPAAAGRGKLVGLPAGPCDLTLGGHHRPPAAAAGPAPRLFQIVTSTGRPVDLLAAAVLPAVVGGQGLLAAVRSAIALAAAPLPAAAAGGASTRLPPALAPRLRRPAAANGTAAAEAGACALLRRRHLFVSHAATLARLLADCDQQLATNQKHALPPLPYSETLSRHEHSGIRGPEVPHVDALPHTELIEEGVHVHVHLAHAEAAHHSRARKYQRLRPAVVTRFDVETAVKHTGYRDAADRRAQTWLQELKRSTDRRGLADAVGHKLCVHSLEQVASGSAGEGLHRDIGVTMGTAMQTDVTEGTLDKMRLKLKTQIIGMFVSPVVGIAQMFIIKPFASAFTVFFNAIMPLLCYFLLLLLLHILMKHGMSELPTAVDRPCGTIIVLFMTWPIVLTVVLVIYHRIGNYIYRSCRGYVLGDLVPQLVEPISHQMSHSLTHSVTTSLSHTMSHALTHTLTHSLSNSVFHFYRCSYCYHYGDYCDLCFYFRDYSWQWRMAWQGNTLLKQP